MKFKVENHTLWHNVYKQKNNNDTEGFIECVQKVVNNTKIMCSYCFLELRMVQYVQLICGKGISPFMAFFAKKAMSIYATDKTIEQGGRT